MKQKIEAATLPTYAGMINQEHAETVIKLLAESVDYRISKIGCTPTTMAIYAKFNSIDDQKEFEAAITPFQVVQWS